eukprot:TRINITY_DN64574_c0_g1_i1.p2 TRINITY_DN64574_c0_g1~~TRINITY_DN64574_c0_g1_i1.p2  ORF type:complete len:164 (-),score=38.75 TRINITY_DN64574_c0_g1_i1:112-603(-)
MLLHTCAKIRKQQYKKLQLSKEYKREKRRAKLRALTGDKETELTIEWMLVEFERSQWLRLTEGIAAGAAVSAQRPPWEDSDSSDLAEGAAELAAEMMSGKRKTLNKRSKPKPSKKQGRPPTKPKPKPKPTKKVRFVEPAGSDGSDDTDDTDDLEAMALAYLQK